MRARFEQALLAVFLRAVAFVVTHISDCSLNVNVSFSCRPVILLHLSTCRPTCDLLIVFKKSNDFLIAGEVS